MPYIFKFSRNKFVRIFGSNSKWNKSRDDINIFKCPAHTVFTAYRGNLKPLLSLQSTEQRRKRLSPSFRIILSSFEILLECKIHFFSWAACGNKLRDTLGNRADRASERRFFKYFRWKTVRHHGRRGTILSHCRKLSSHYLLRRKLAFTAVR